MQAANFSEMNTEKFVSRAKFESVSPRILVRRDIRHIIGAIKLDTWQLISEFKKITTATAVETSINTRFNKQTKVLYVRYNSLYISLPSSAKHYNAK